MFSEIPHVTNLFHKGNPKNKCFLGKKKCDTNKCSSHPVFFLRQLTLDKGLGAPEKTARHLFCKPVHSFSASSKLSFCCCVSLAMFHWVRKLLLEVALAT